MITKSLELATDFLNPFFHTFKKSKNCLYYHRKCFIGLKNNSFVIESGLKNL